MLRQYERERRDGRLPATFEIVYGHAWKPEQPSRNAADAPAVIRFERPGGRR
jgi:malonyl-CoA O-methyltransferase